MNYKNIIITIILLSSSVSIVSGQTISEMREMYGLYNRYKSGEFNKLTQSLVEGNTSNSNVEELTKQDLPVQNPATDSLKNFSKYFGYDFFSQRESIPFWPNITSPESYLLGPGDNVEITLWGRAQFNGSFTINRDGNIYDKSIGIITLDGKTLKEARDFLRNKYAQKFSSLQGKTPSTFINVTLGELKSINVHFTGNVLFKGVHVLHPMSTVITGLLQAGGVDTSGSLRKINIYRSDELFQEIDLYNYLLNGRFSDNIFLQNNDVINVPSRISTITIEGEVYRNGIYEAKESESLANIVHFAGGFKPEASNRMILKRISPISKRFAYVEPIEYQTIMNDQLDKVIAQDGDLLTISSIPDVTNEIKISGQVKNPGSYILTDSMTVKDLLIIAGGIEDENYLKSTYLDQIEIIRVDDKSNNNIILELNYKDLLSANNLNKYLLQKDDHIIVHKNINYRMDNNVYLSGEIAIPGMYSLKNKNEKMDEIIYRSGGFTDDAFIDGINITRHGKRLVWDELSIELAAGDSVFVPKRPGVVEIKGEVYNPGLVHYKKGRSVMSYVNSAGGVTNNGSRFKISVMYPNGSVSTTKLIPRAIKDGCIVIVNKKPYREPFSLENFLSKTVSIMSTVALTYVAVKTLN